MQRAAIGDIAEANPVACMQMFVEDRALDVWIRIRRIGGGDGEGRSRIRLVQVNHNL